MKKGFTLLELVIVIIVVGILATLGLTQYIKVLEKTRAAEARMILGQIRTAQVVYAQEHGANPTDFTDDITLLMVDAPTACISSHYFSYSTNSTDGIATRCTSSPPGKKAGPAYVLSINYIGNSVITSTPTGY